MSVYVDHYVENLNDLTDEEKPDEAHEVEKESATNDQELVVYPHVEGDEFDTSKEVSEIASLNEKDEDIDGPKLVVYPRHDPTQPWKLMKPVLGMKFESPKQLKQCLCNYGIANGYQLWFEKNYYKRLLVRCGKGNDGVR